MCINGKSALSQQVIALTLPQKKKTHTHTLMMIQILTSGVGVEGVCVHKGESIITAGALLCVALVHGVHHHGHLLPSAAQGLLTLLSQLPVHTHTHTHTHTQTKHTQL